MTLRPLGGQPNPGRGGEGRRRRYSESAIPRRGIRRVRGVGAPDPGTFYVLASFEDDQDWSAFPGHTGQCELVIPSIPSVSYSDVVDLSALGFIAAGTQIRYEFTWLDPAAGPWDYARVRVAYGDGSSTPYLLDGEYGRDATPIDVLEQDGTYPVRLIDADGLITQ